MFSIQGPNQPLEGDERWKTRMQEDTRREVTKVNTVSFTSFVIRQFLILALVTVLVIGWSATANAQTSFDTQYGDPMASSQEAIESSGASSGTSDPGSSSDPGSVAAAGVLPNTGGSLFPFFALGALALGSTGLLMIRHNSRR